MNVRWVVMAMAFVGLGLESWGAIISENDYLRFYADRPASWHGLDGSDVLTSGEVVPFGFVTEFTMNQRAAIVEGFNWWSEAVGYRLVFLEQAPLFSWQQVNVGWRWMDGSGNTVGTGGAFFGSQGVTSGGSISFDAADLGWMDLRYVAAHEMGHVLNFAHKNNSLAVMNSGYSVGGGLTAQDLEQAQWLYGYGLSSVPEPCVILFFGIGSLLLLRRQL